MNEEGGENEADGTQDESSKTAHYFVFSGDNKAGMHGYEKKRQAQIIYDMSKNSSFFKQAEKQDQKRKIKINETKKKVDQYVITKYTNLGRGVKNNIEKLVDSYEREYEAQRDVSTIKVVVDMDMFFAAVAIRDRPHLKDKPVAIGGMSMLSTSNYVARTFGVRSAMPGFIAKKLCPHLVFIGHENEKYKEASSIVKEIMREYDPNVVSYSLDEFFLDLTAFTDREVIRRSSPHGGSGKGKEGKPLQTDSGAISGRSECMVSGVEKGLKRNLRDMSEEDEDEDEDGEDTMALWSSHLAAAAGAAADGPSSGGEVTAAYRRQVACEVVQEMRQRVCVATGGLTCSAGIANNSFLAKIGADQNKPDGQFSLPPTREAILNFMVRLPCRKIPGIGRVTENVLNELELNTMGDVLQHGDKVLVAFSPKLGRFLIRASLGIGSSEGLESKDVIASASFGGGVSHGSKSVDDDEDDDGKQQSELQKSIGTERTFPAMNDRGLLLEKLEHICQRVHADLQKHGVFGGGVTLKIKTSGFHVYTRSTTVAHYSPGIFRAEDIFQVAKGLFLAFMATCGEKVEGNEGIAGSKGEDASKRRPAREHGGVRETGRDDDDDDDNDDDNDDNDDDGTTGISPFRAARPVSEEASVPDSDSSRGRGRVCGRAASVSLRLMGVQITKLGRMRAPGDTGGSIRDSKLCKMLLSSATSSTPASAVHSSHCDEQKEKQKKKLIEQSSVLGSKVLPSELSSSLIGTHDSSLSSSAAPFSPPHGKSCTSGRAKGVRVSILDMMYSQPKALSLLSSAHPEGAAADVESSMADNSVPRVSCIDGSEGCLSTDSSLSTPRGVSASSLPKSFPNDNHLNQTAIESSTTPPLSLEGLRCPICRHTSASLHQLNVHLDRNCEEFSLSPTQTRESCRGRSHPRKIAKTLGGTSNITKYFGFQSSH